MTLHAALALFAANSRIDAKWLPASVQIFAIPTRFTISRAAEKRFGGRRRLFFSEPLCLCCGDDCLLRLIIPTKGSPKDRSSQPTSGRTTGRATDWLAISGRSTRSAIGRILSAELPLSGCAAQFSLPDRLETAPHTRGHPQPDCVSRPIRGCDRPAARRILYSQTSPSRKAGAALTPWFSRTCNLGSDSQAMHVLG
jgi:hypothetical protein